MNEVFVSFSLNDIGAALPIIVALRRAGLSVFSVNDLLGGDDWAQSISREFKTAQCRVFIWSQAAAKSTFVQREIREAIRAWSSDRLVLAALDDTQLPVGLRDFSPISIQGGSGTSELVKSVLATVHPPTMLDSIAEFRIKSSSMPAGAHAFGHRKPLNKKIVGTWAAIAVAMLAVAGMAYIFWLYAGPQPFSRDLELKGGGSSPSLLFILMALFFGAAIGAGAVWVFISRSKRAMSPAPSSQARPAPNDAVGIVTSSITGATTDTGGPQLFVSYSQQDTQTVDQLVRQLEQLGYTVWIDRRSPGSQRYAGPIVHAIRTSRLVALMCSHNAFASDHVLREVYIAGDYKKPFIAFQLDPTELPDDILYFLTGFPRVPVTTIDPQKLSLEIKRLITA